MSTTLAVALKELRQIRRDARTLGILMFLPAFFLLLYGYALNFDIRHIPLGVEDRDQSADSRQIVSAFINSGYFDLVATVRSEAEIERLMNEGVTRAVLILPEGTGRRLETREAATIQVLINGDNANTAATVMGYVQGIVSELSVRYQVEGVAGPGRAPPVRAEPRIWWNPELRSTLFLVPGLIAYIMMITAVVSTALSIVREKERGTMEQIRMAPIGTLAYIVGKTLPYFAISLASAVLIVLTSMALFDLPVRGSWMLLLVALSLFIAGALGTGLLVSTIADSQQMAFQMSLLIAFLPTLMLSGFIFPISSMPVFVRAITYAVPARYFLSALRDILLKGVEVQAFLVELGALAGYAAAVLALASVRLARQWA